jgi:L-methionine (R)-S-oxide reductase
VNTLDCVRIGCGSDSRRTLIFMTFTDDILVREIKAVVLDNASTRESRARQVALLIHSSRSYHWVGIYEVGREQISALAWTGSSPPAFPTFPITQGLNGVAVSSRETVIVNDVTAEPRYLTTFGTTRSEMIVPVLHKSGAVVGTIDVESDRANAFNSRDREALEACADALVQLWP